MINNEIVNYIKVELTRGETKENIYNSLTQAGWLSTDIQEAFNSFVVNVQIPQSSSSNVEVITEKEYPITWLWVFKAPLIILIITIIGLIFGLWFPYLVITFPFFLIANPLRKANFHFSFKDKFLFIQEGVISKKERNLPYGVIQTVLVKQDLFDRIFSLSSLRIENASYGGVVVIKEKRGLSQPGESVGSTLNKINIPGLRKAHAEKLKTLLLQKIKENPYDDSQSGL